MTYEKISLSMPADLAAELERQSQEVGLSRSQAAVTLIQKALSLETQNQKLIGRIAELEAEAQWLALTPTSFPDFLTKDPPGTHRLKRDIDFLERQRKEAHVKLAQLEALTKAQERELENLGHDLKAERDNGATAQRIAENLQGQLAAQIDREKALENSLAISNAQHRPWHLRIPVPIIVPLVTRPAIDRPNFNSALSGAFAFAATLFLGLVLVPNDTWPMRHFAMAAMGTWGDAPAAAARLHGGPVGGHDTLLQVYTLMKAGRNAQRLDQCFERSRNTPPRKAVAIDCTIKIPSEFELYSTLVSSGPYSESSRGKRTLENAQRQLDALQRLDRAEQ